MIVKDYHNMINLLIPVGNFWSRERKHGKLSLPGPRSENYRQLYDNIIII